MSYCLISNSIKYREKTYNTFAQKLQPMILGYDCDNVEEYLYELYGKVMNNNICLTLSNEKFIIYSESIKIFVIYVDKNEKEYNLCKKHMTHVDNWIRDKYCGYVEKIKPLVNEDLKY